MTAIKTLETNIIHAGDVIYWLNGGTAESETEMGRLTRPVTVQLTTKPAGLKMLSSTGKTAFWRSADGAIVDGMADETAKAFPSTAPYTLAGCVKDFHGHYNPRKFSIVAGSASGHRIVLYPSPLGTRFTNAGGLKGNLRRRGTEAVVPWAMLTLQVNTTLGGTMTFRAQADDRGDFMLPLKRLPPLPEGITHYDAVLMVAAPDTTATSAPLDPAVLTAASIGSPDSESTFSASINLKIVFGEIRTIQTFNKNCLSLQPN